TVAGREVVQLYVTAPAGALDKPERELKAFAKTGELAPGESQTVEMTFATYDLASFDESASAFVADKGTYNARFCTDVRSEQASMEFTVPARKTFPVNQALDRSK
ncbi:MAG: fibronectin type III-like domain-contianing protein, partial [Bacteroidales bacterium]|nr:fibronectin type III-like domain-contianing protein [Bacteroidales bacterium]